MTDQELAGWARNWHWQDCAEDKPVDPSIYFRDMRMLKAFIAKFGVADVAQYAPRHEALEPFAAELARQERVRSYRDGDCYLADCRLTIGDLRRLCAVFCKQSGTET